MYYSFKASLIKGFEGVLAFDVYIKLSNQYVLLFKKNTTVDISRLEGYIKNNLKELYVSMEDKGLVQALLGIKEDHDTKNIGDSSNFKATIKDCVEDLFEKNRISRDILNKVDKTVEDFTSIIASSPSELAGLLSSISDNAYFMYHSTSVSILAIHIARLYSPENKNLHKIVGMGGFLHDIGKAGTKEHEFNTVLHPELSENINYLKHPDTGYVKFEKLDYVSKDIKLVISQHHEKPNGKGFPNKLRSYNIFLPSKIVSTANNFSKLIAKRPFGRELKPIEGVRQLLLYPEDNDMNIVSCLAKVYNIGIA